MIERNALDVEAPILYLNGWEAAEEIARVLNADETR